MEIISSVKVFLCWCHFNVCCSVNSCVCFHIVIDVLVWVPHEQHLVLFVGLILFVGLPSQESVVFTRDSSKKLFIEVEE